MQNTETPASRILGYAWQTYFIFYILALQIFLRLFTSSLYLFYFKWTCNHFHGFKIDFFFSVLSLHIFSLFIVNPFVSLIWKISAHHRHLAFYLHLLVYFITLHIIWRWNECHSLGVSYFIYIIWTSVVYFQIIVAETYHKQVLLWCSLIPR